MLRTVARTGRSFGRRATSAARTLPDFVVIGTQKGGTTSLYDHLTQHPRVRRALGKGVHYFDEHHDRGLDWYRSQFPMAFGRDSDTAWLTGEASPDYMFLPAVPARMARAVPGVKLIAVLRNPVDRAASHHAHERSKGREPLELEQALEREASRLERELLRADEDHSYDSVTLRRYSYKARGRYAEQLERWLAAFPRDQVLVVSSEQLYADPRAVTADVLAFLGLPAHPGTTYRQLNARSYTAVPEHLRQRLLAEFRPHNERLFELLDTEFPWDD